MSGLGVKNPSRLRRVRCSGVRVCRQRAFGIVCSRESWWGFPHWVCAVYGTASDWRKYPKMLDSPASCRLVLFLM
jgi:hypothetical protein